MGNNTSSPPSSPRRSYSVWDGSTPLLLELALYGPFNPENTTNVTALVHASHEQGTDFTAPSACLVTAWRICPYSGTAYIDGPTRTLTHDNPFPVAVAFTGLNPSQYMDVTNTLRTHLLSGSPSVAVENSTFGGDPARDIYKRLLVCVTPLGSNLQPLDTVPEGGALQLNHFTRDPALLLTGPERLNAAGRQCSARLRVSEECSSAWAVERVALGRVAKESARLEGAKAKAALVPLLRALHLHPKNEAELASLRQATPTSSLLVDAMEDAMEGKLPPLPPCTDTLEDLEGELAVAREVCERCDAALAMTPLGRHWDGVQPLPDLPTSSGGGGGGGGSVGGVPQSGSLPSEGKAAAAVAPATAATAAPSTTIPSAGQQWIGGKDQNGVTLGSIPGLPIAIARTFNLGGRIGDGLKRTLAWLGINVENEAATLITELRLYGEVGCVEDKPRSIRITFGGEGQCPQMIVPLREV